MWNIANQKAMFSRLELLLGKKNLRILRESEVLLCGVGGVGSWAAEALIRSGIGKLTLVDPDVVKPSNLNRQLCALHSTLDQAKVQVMATRLKDIAPDALITPLELHLTPDNTEELFTQKKWDCVLDAIDERPAKLELLRQCVRRNIPVVSSMGAANKTDPDLVKEADIAQSHACPLAKCIRKHLRKEGITTGIRVIFSEEISQTSVGEKENPEEKRPLGSLVTLTAQFGLRCASAVLNQLLFHLVGGNDAIVR